MEKVVAYIDENLEAFVTGELQRPSVKDNSPVYMWFKINKNKSVKYHNGELV